MKRSSNIRRRKPPQGFTLIEILVVVGIIIFLVAMTVSVVTGVIASSRAKATKATIKKIDGLLTHRMEAFTLFIDDQNQSPQPQYLGNATLFPASLTPHSSNLSPAQLAGGNPERAKVLGRKALFRQGFPQTLEEAGIAVPSGDDPVTQSSEALYYFLTSLPSYGQEAVGEDAFGSNEVDDTDKDGLMEFVDAWGKPLRFYRWPTRLIRPGDPATTPQAINTTTKAYDNPVKVKGYFGEAGYDASIFFATLPDAATLAEDSDDVLGVTQGASWKYSDGSGPQQMTPTTFEKDFHLHTPDTWSSPLIVSAGADGMLGLYEAGDTANYGHLAQPHQTEYDGMLDNLSSRNLLP